MDGLWNNATPDESIVIGNRYWSVIEWEPCCVGNTGNVNGDPDGSFDLSDLIFLINYLFLGGPEPPCMAAANFNGDAGCQVDLSDLIYGVATLFLGGQPPAECNPDCL